MKQNLIGGQGNLAAVTLAVLVLFASVLFASTPAQTLTVHEVAGRVDQHYNQLHTLKAGFSESYSGMGRKRTETGTLLMAKPGRMRWDYSSPSGKLFLLDGKYAWFYTHGQAQAQRIAAKKLDDLRSPLRFLLGHTQLEKELVGLAMKPGSGSTFVLTGKLKGQEQRVPRIELTVTAEGAILSMVAEENDGSITEFRFLNEQPNAPAPAASFQFVPPPGVTVVDAEAQQ